MTSSCASRCSTEAALHFEAADFDYDLPPERVAQHPHLERSASRMLALDRATGTVQDLSIRDLPQQLAPGDVLVFNDTRVIPARCFGRKPTGGKLEILIERLLPNNRALAQLGANRAPAPDSDIILAGEVRVRLIERQGRFWVLQFPAEVAVGEFLEQEGQVPLPPYIERPPEPNDRERYQTVYARAPGAVAAPTAGLHFDEPLLGRLDEQGIERIHVTLHVGAGTFQPIEADDIREHRIHAERLAIDADACARINRARTQGRRVVAVGTTSARALESAVRPNGRIEPYDGDTRLYLYPGCDFAAIDGLLTNFHLPRSSLLVMVCAFAGHEATLHAYRHAVAAKYRFYSYGDAMLIL